MFPKAACGGVAFIAATLAASVLLPRLAADMVVRGAAALACAVGVGFAAWTGWRVRGDERRWRWLVAGALAFALLAVVGIVEAAAAGRAFPDVSRHYGLYLLAYVLVFAAIVTFPSVPQGSRDDPPYGPGHYRYATVLLDSLLVIGSLLLLDRIAVFRHAVADKERLALFVAGDVAKLVIVIAALLVPSFRQLRSSVSFALLAGGVVAHALSASTFLYVVGGRWSDVPPPLVTGFVAAPVLITLACLAPPTDRDDPPDRVSSRALWVRVVLSYLPVATVAVVALAMLAIRWNFEELELYGVLLLLLVALARQMILLVDNNHLLALVRHQARHDPLTGLANRTLFFDRLTYSVARHSRDHQELALLFCDLDNFKDFNDNLGHPVGDELLRTVADRLAGAVRSADTVARLGGDEFAVILDGGGGDPVTTAQRVVDAVRGPPDPAGARRNPVHLSAGLVVAGPDAGPVTADTLLRSADLAMYAAKHQGKGELVVYRPEVHGRAPKPPQRTPSGDQHRHIV